MKSEKYKTVVVRIPAELLGAVTGLKRRFQAGEPDKLDEILQEIRLVKSIVTAASHALPDLKPSVLQVKLTPNRQAVLNCLAEPGSTQAIFNMLYPSGTPTQRKQLSKTLQDLTKLGLVEVQTKGVGTTPTVWRRL